jgi:hypothetical protein
MIASLFSDKPAGGPVQPCAGARNSSPFAQSPDKIAKEVNPSGSNQNCGNIIDAVVARLRGTNPNATAPDKQDGSFPDIEKRFGTTLDWNHSLDDAYDAVKKGGNGTVAIVGIIYSGGTASHVVVLANDNGKVGIVEGQSWSPTQNAGFITDQKAANDRYSPDGKSNVGFGIILPDKK